jgi:pSer/pThr/pTyr-binding forkhead associated (FHA) protein
MFMLRDARGQVYPIPEQGLRIGRAARNDLMLADEEVSRYHATAWVQGGQAYIRDENSTNGTWVNPHPGHWGRHVAAPLRHARPAPGGP